MDEFKILLVDDDYEQKVQLQEAIDDYNKKLFIQELENKRIIEDQKYISGLKMKQRSDIYKTTRRWKNK